MQAMKQEKGQETEPWRIHKQHTRAQVGKARSQGVEREERQSMQADT
jgi:hypothetical protein